MVADKATGFTVLSELYEKMGKVRYEPDLKQLWTDLGIVDSPEGARLNEHGAFANIRQAITTAPLS